MQILDRLLPAAYRLDLVEEQVEGHVRTRERAVRSGLVVDPLDEGRKLLGVVQQIAAVV